MGAAPRLALLSLALPPALPLRRLRRDRRRACARSPRAHRVHVVGGNLTRSPGPLVIDVTAVGHASSARQVLTRGGARPGDEIYVSGTIGAAAAGLADAAATARRRARRSTTTAQLRRALPLSGAARAARPAARPQPRGVGVHGSERRPRRRRPPDRRGQRRRHARSTPTRCRSTRRARAGSSARTRSGARSADRRRRLRAAVHGPRRGCAAGCAPSRATAGVPLTRIGVCTREPARSCCATSTAPRVDEPLPRGFSHFR